MIFKNEDKKLKTYCKIEETDSFWDIDDITPNRKPVNIEKKRFDSEFAVVYDSIQNTNTEKKNGLLFSKPITKQQPVLTRSYSPENSIIKKVDVFTWSSKYTFYERFRNDAKKYFNISHEKTDPVRYYSYIPGYVQMSVQQRNWYLYWRERVRNGEYIQTDSSYILLYIYEIINLPELVPAEEGIKLIIDIWKQYRSIYTKFDKYMSEWICDYCLVNKLTFPDEYLSDILPDVIESSSFKQFYIVCEKGNEYANLLLEKMSTYRWRKSKYYVGENKSIFDEHIKSAIEYSVNRLAIHDGRFDGKNGRLVEKTTVRDSFSGAVCAYDIKRKIELTYYDLENTGDLSFVVSDMVKYCENRIRAYLGIRSRLGIKNLTAQHKQIINEYFDEHLPVYSRERNNKISNDYDDDNKIERKPFSVSIEKAREIERESWTVTDKLVDEEFFDSVDDSEKNAETAENVSIESESLDIAKKALICVYKSDSRGFNKIAQDNYMLPQTLAECVNELCYEAIGDIGIEEKDGEYIIIPDYEQEIRKWLSK